MVIRITLPAGYQGGQEQDTMRQYVQTDREVHRQVATALAELILGGVMPALENPPPQKDAPNRADSRSRGHPGTEEPGATAPRPRTARTW